MNELKLKFYIIILLLKLVVVIYQTESMLKLRYLFYSCEIFFFFKTRRMYFYYRFFFFQLYYITYMAQIYFRQDQQFTFVTSEHIYFHCGMHFTWTTVFSLQLKAKCYNMRVKEKKCYNINVGFFKKVLQYECWFLKIKRVQPTWDWSKW